MANMDLPTVQSSCQAEASSCGDFAVNFRRGISSFFETRSTIARRPETQNAVSPKLPPPPLLGLSRVSAHLSIHIPSITTPAPLTPRSPSSTRSMIDATPSPASRIFPHVQLASETREGRSPSESLSFQSGSQSTEQRNTEQARSGEGLEANTLNEGQRHKRLQKLKERSRSTSAALRHKEARSKTIACAVLGVALTIFISTYLGLALSNTAAGPDFHILFILAIMILSIFFCHASGRLLILVVRPPRYEDSSLQRATRRAGGPSEVVAPEIPIQIILARDEEEGCYAEVEAEQGPKETSIRVPPPVYGVWNDTLKMDPNFVHWRRVNESVIGSITPANQRNGNEEGQARPPSYLSDDGVTYVLDAQPRSTTAAPPPTAATRAVRSPRRERMRTAVNMLAFR